MPGTAWHCGAAEIRKMGRPLRLASASPSFKVPYHAIFGEDAEHVIAQDIAKAVKNQHRSRCCIVSLQV